MKELIKKIFEFCIPTIKNQREEIRLMHKKVDRLKGDSLRQEERITAKNREVIKVNKLLAAKITENLLLEVKPADTMSIPDGKGGTKDVALSSQDREIAAITKVATLPSTPLDDRLRNAYNMRLEGNLKRAAEVTDDIEANIRDIHETAKELKKEHPDSFLIDRMVSRSGFALQWCNKIIPEGERIR